MRVLVVGRAARSALGSSLSSSITATKCSAPPVRPRGPNVCTPWGRSRMVLDALDGPAINIVDDEPAAASVWVPALAKVVGAKPSNTSRACSPGCSRARPPS
jgi:hypothetical protein